MSGAQFIAIDMALARRPRSALASGRKTKVAGHHRAPKAARWPVAPRQVWHLPARARLAGRRGLRHRHERGPHHRVLASSTATALNVVPGLMVIDTCRRLSGRETQRHRGGRHLRELGLWFRGLAMLGARHPPQRDNAAEAPRQQCAAGECHFALGVHRDEGGDDRHAVLPQRRTARRFGDCTFGRACSTSRPTMMATPSRPQATAVNSEEERAAAGAVQGRR